MKFLAVADPATRSTFAGLFIAFNEKTQDMYLLDEIYERDTENTRVAVIGPLFDEKAFKWSGNWEAIYDPAEPWFPVNVRDHSKLEWVPAKKFADNKDHGFSQIKDLYFSGKMHVHESLFWVHEEISKYKKIKNRQGNYSLPKHDDHLIDCLRYVVEWFGVDIKAVEKGEFPVAKLTREQELAQEFGLKTEWGDDEPDVWDIFQDSSVESWGDF